GEESINGLMCALQKEIRTIADRQLGNERAGHTLQATALVNEAYLRMLNQRNLEGSTRTQFLAAAAQTIRRILVDYARAKGADNRGGDWSGITLSAVEPAANDSRLDMLALDEAMEKLQSQSKRVHQVVMCRCFSGMTEDETAEAVGMSRRTVADDWAFGLA